MVPASGLLRLMSASPRFRNAVSLGEVEGWCFNTAARGKSWPTSTSSSATRAKIVSAVQALAEILRDQDGLCGGIQPFYPDDGMTKKSKTHLIRQSVLSSSGLNLLSPRTGLEMKYQEPLQNVVWFRLL